MKPQFINSKLAPKFSNLSQCARVGDILFLGGVVGETPEDYLPTTMREQAKLCFDNIKFILEEAGSDLEHIASTNLLVDMAATEEDEAVLNEVWRETFPVEELRPCRCCYRVDLQEGYLVEVVNTVATLKK